MPLFQFPPLPTVLISNCRHSIIYWWIFKSNSSKESCCEVGYEAYDKIHMWRISIVFFAYFDFVFDEPLKHDTYSPYISLIICIIFYYPLAIVWAITFENPSINEEMAAIWNFYVGNRFYFQVTSNPMQEVSKLSSVFSLEFCMRHRHSLHRLS